MWLNFTAFECLMPIIIIILSDNLKQEMGLTVYQVWQRKIFHSRVYKMCWNNELSNYKSMNLKWYTHTIKEQQFNSQKVRKKFQCYGIFSTYWIWEQYKECKINTQIKHSVINKISRNLFMMSF